MALSVDLLKLFWTHSGLNTFNLHLVWILKNIFQEKRVLVICLIQTVVLLWCVVIYSFWFYEWFSIRYSFVDLRNFVVDWNIAGMKLSMFLSRSDYIWRFDFLCSYYALHFLVPIQNRNKEVTHFSSIFLSRSQYITF